MGYIGSTPTTQSFIAGTDSFNGTGSATNFTLSRFVNSTNDIQVVVNNVVQYPPNYSVSGNTLTISPAPSAGTNNVYVRYLSTTLQTFAPSQGTIGRVQLDIGNLNGTGAAAMPVGTTAQVPGAPTTGMFRMNSSTNEPEWYDSIRGRWVAFGDRTYDIEMFAWGGGGGGAGGSGGGGGAARGVMNVDKSTPFAVVIGGGGIYRPGDTNAGPPVPGGGGLTGNLGYGGQGGGYSGIFLISSSQINARLIAGGGGGSAWEGASGGAGGGTNGVAGSNGSLAGGGGGTQSAGGTSVSQAGSALQGGTSGAEGDSGGSGGGGGGYWGGGAGSNTNPGSAGGGGSGYFNSTFVTSAVLTAGSGATPGDSANSLRSGAGQGGAVGANNGAGGIFIIRYLGPQRGTGGTVTSSGGYTIHTFTTAGTYIA